MYWYLVLITAASLAYLYRLSIKTELQKVLEYVIVRVMREPLAMTMVGVIAQLTQPSSTTISVKSKSKWIKFKSDNSSYAVPLPFDRKKKEASITYKMKDGETKSFLYPRGVPFFCTPDDLGCESITIVVDDRIGVYEGKDIPVL